MYKQVLKVQRLLAYLFILFVTIQVVWAQDEEQEDRRSAYLLRVGELESGSLRESLLALHQSEDVNAILERSRVSVADDTPMQNINLKFDFPFPAQVNSQNLRTLSSLTFTPKELRHHSVRISPNGALSFNHIPTCGERVEIPNLCNIVKSYYNHLCPLLTDLFPPYTRLDQNDGGVFYISTATMFTVLWENIPSYMSYKFTNPDTFTFSVTLHASGRFNFRYEALGESVENLLKSTETNVLVGLVAPQVLGVTLSSGLTDAEKELQGQWQQKDLSQSGDMFVQAPRPGVYPPVAGVKAGKAVHNCLLPDRSEYTFTSLATCARIAPADPLAQDVRGVIVSLDPDRPLLGCLDAGFPLECVFADSLDTHDPLVVDAARALNPETGVEGALCSLGADATYTGHLDSQNQTAFNGSLPNATARAFDTVSLRYRAPSLAQLNQLVSDPGLFAAVEPLDLVFDCPRAAGFGTPEPKCPQGSVLDCDDQCQASASEATVIGYGPTELRFCCRPESIDCMGYCDGGALPSANPFNLFEPVQCCKSPVCDKDGTCTCQQAAQGSQDAVAFWRTVSAMGGTFSILCVMVAFYMVYKTSVDQRRMLQAAAAAERRRALPPEGREEFINVVKFEPGVALAPLGQAAAAEPGLEASCSVCICDFDRGEEVAVLLCGHSFHNACLLPWFEKSALCPLCRQDVRGPDFRPEPDPALDRLRRRPLPTPSRLALRFAPRRGPVLSEADAARAQRPHSAALAGGLREGLRRARTLPALARQGSAPTGLRSHPGREHAAAQDLEVVVPALAVETGLIRGEGTAAGDPEGRARGPELMNLEAAVPPGAAVEDRSSPPPMLRTRSHLVMPNVRKSSVLLQRASSMFLRNQVNGDDNPRFGLQENAELEL